MFRSKFLQLEENDQRKLQKKKKIGTIFFFKMKLEDEFSWPEAVRTRSGRRNKKGPKKKYEKK